MLQALSSTENWGGTPMALWFLVKKSLILRSYPILRILCGTLVLHFSGALYHGIHGNAPLCGTEGAGERGLRAFQPQIDHLFKTSGQGRRRHVSEVPEGLLRAAFGAPLTRASVFSVVKQRPFAKVGARHRRCLSINTVL